TGKDSDVEEYVFKWPVARRFMEKTGEYLDFLLTQYAQEGRSHVLIGIGCTGGRHRSVAIAERLGEFLRSRGLTVSVQHRDLGEWRRRGSDAGAFLEVALPRHGREALAAGHRRRRGSVQRRADLDRRYCSSGRSG